MKICLKPSKTKNRQRKNIILDHKYVGQMKKNCEESVYIKSRPGKAAAIIYKAINTDLVIMQGKLVVEWTLVMTLLLCNLVLEQWKYCLIGPMQLSLHTIGERIRGLGDYIYVCQSP